MDAYPVPTNRGWAISGRPLRGTFTRMSQTSADILTAHGTNDMIRSKFQGTTIAFGLAACVCFGQAISPKAQRLRKGDLSARDIARRSFPSVVVLVAEDRSGDQVLGSGFFIDNNIIATNYHVVKGATKIVARSVGQKRVNEVSVFRTDAKEDLALLRVEQRVMLPLTLAHTTVAVGDVVYVVGNPEGLEGTFSQGIVSALRGNSFVQITAPISHGSSGGPVLNARGEVIGVAVGAIEEGQNLNFAIPVARLVALLKRTSDPSTTQVSSSRSRSVSKEESTPSLREREWQLVTSSDSQQDYFSRARIRVTPEQTSLAWIKSIPNDSEEGRTRRKNIIDLLNAANVNRVNRSSDFSYWMEQWEFDCGHRKMRNLLDSAFYDKEGNLLYSEDASDFEEQDRAVFGRWQSVLPDSVAEKHLNFVCKGQ